MTTIENIRSVIQKVLDTQRDFTSENAKEQALALMWVLELFDKYAEQEQRLWNNHQVACLLADMFDDACACNYNGIDEWLPELCDFKDTCCPNPVGVACWEQFLKHSKARYCECGYEMR